MESETDIATQGPPAAPRSSALAAAVINASLDDLLDDLNAVRLAKAAAANREKAARTERDRYGAEEEALMGLITLKRALEPGQDEEAPHRSASGVLWHTNNFLKDDDNLAVHNFAHIDANSRVLSLRNALETADHADPEPTTGTDAGAVNGPAPADEARHGDGRLSLAQLTAAFDAQTAIAAVGGASGPVTYGGKITTRSMIVALMLDRPEKLTWTARELHAELVRDHPELTRNVVRVTLRRMVKRGEMMQINDAYRLPEGVYQLAIAAPAERDESSEAQERGSD